MAETLAKSLVGNGWFTEYSLGFGSGVEMWLVRLADGVKHPVGYLREQALLVFSVRSCSGRHTAR